MRHVVTAVVLLALLAGCGEPATTPQLALSVRVNPTPVPVLDGTMLVYEVYVPDHAAPGLAVSRIEILRDGPSGEVLRSYAGPGLQGIVARPPGLVDTAVLLLGLTLPPGVAVPATLHHRVTFANGRVVRGGVVTPSTRPPVEILPPLRGDRWVAANGPTTTPVYHRNAAADAIGGLYLSERFAVDWIQLGADGLVSTGDGSNPFDWVGYGADLLAVADGTVVDARDGLPDNTLTHARSIPMTLENIMGNYVVLDIRDGHDRFAVYAHLVPGTLQVRIGERVSAGQLLGRLGNSGNSDAPHLHFHVCDGVGPLGPGGEALFCDGQPYTFPSFSLLGSVGSGPGGWSPSGPPQALTGQMMLLDQVVNLGP